MGKTKAKKTTRHSTESTPKKEGVPLNTSWHTRFLEILGTTCNITLAARGAGIDRVTAYNHYKALPEFASAWEDAKEAAVEILEAEAWQRARKQSDTLMIFLLKAHKPDKYRERMELAQTSVNINWDDLTENELERIAAGESPTAVLATRGTATPRTT